MLKGQVISFTAQKNCKLNGFKFNPEDQIIVTLNRNVDLESDREGDGGPWGWGGYTSQFVKSIASRIEDAGNGNVIFKK